MSNPLIGMMAKQAVGNMPQAQMMQKFAEFRRAMAGRDPQQMIDEMLVAQEKWLPQYTEAIKEAKENLAKGDLIPTKDYHGAARLREKTPEEVAAEHEARKITV